MDKTEDSKSDPKTYLLWERRKYGNKITIDRIKGDIYYVSGCVQDPPVVGNLLKVYSKRNNMTYSTDGDTLLTYEFTHVIYGKKLSGLFIGEIKEIIMESVENEYGHTEILHSIPEDVLKDMLKESVEEERYERSAIIQKEIERRKTIKTI